MNWALLRKRVFDIDVEHCACGGKLKFVAVIEQPEGIEKLLYSVRQKRPLTPLVAADPVAAECLGQVERLVRLLHQTRP